MKALHVNLASRPFRDYKPVYAVVVAVSIVVAVLMFYNFDTFYRYQRDTKNTRNEIALIETQIRTENTRAENAKGQIGAIDLVTLSKQSKFVNTELAQRAFSWSELLDRLEVVLPANVRVVSVSPGFESSGLVHLNINCEGKNADSMLATITRFQHDPHFSNPFPASQSAKGSEYEFALTVEYKPTVARPVSQ